MKLIFKVESETKTTGYKTVALSVICDDPDVEVSISNTATGEGRLFVKASPEKVPLVLNDVIEAIIAGDAEEGGEGAE
jgi:hypothetical protein